MGAPPPDTTDATIELAGVPGMVEDYVPADVGREVERRVAAGLALVLSLEDRLGRADVPGDVEAELVDRHARLVAKVGQS